jgi:hypothetical protein
MSADTPKGTPAHLLPRLLITIATRALPRGVSRDRYRREFAAELFGLGRRQQLGYAGGAAVHILALRTVLVRGVDATHVPVLCRMNIHHHWMRHVSDEHIAFELCTRCGKEKDPVLRTREADAGAAIGFGFGNVQ